MAKPRIPPGVLAMVTSSSQLAAVEVAAEHTSKSSVVTPTRNGYDRAEKAYIDNQF